MISACQYQVLQARETRVRFPVREFFLLFNFFILSSPFHFLLPTNDNKVNVILRTIFPKSGQASMCQTDNWNYYHAHRPRRHSQTPSVCNRLETISSIECVVLQHPIDLPPGSGPLFPVSQPVHTSYNYACTVSCPARYPSVGKSQADDNAVSPHATQQQDLCPEPLMHYPIR